NPASTSSSLLWDIYWIRRGGPPVGGPLTVGELYGGGSLSEPRVACGRREYGRPVDSASGNFFHAFDDLSIPGRGPGLDLSHTYNSLAAGTDGPLGFGWAHSDGMSLVQDPSSGQTTVNEENGAKILFSSSGNAYVAAPRVAASLAHNADGTFTFTRRAKG